ncbi:MAG TPA: M42 family metallopeptidase [Anaerolineales bacterium]|nr:M42 family metallopeptidase [Anaerolineales bacterium]HND49435.1 M42 family metallopeptidase [Anaerolineales bacterium]HNE04445.1 M42 family metallopeptidase [Anaerolineales bacterium]
MKSLLKTLTETYAPSGYEDAVRKIIQKEVKPYADEIRVDAMGSLIVRKKPTVAAQNSKRIMLAAHMDEIGVIVSHVDKNGFVRFASNGGVFGRYTLGARVRFMNGVTGVIGFDKLEAVDQAPSLSKMYIDVGASSRSDCPVKVGDFGAFERSYMEMGNRLVAKSMDDRAGVVVLIEALKSIKITPHDLYFVFTTQEEVGTRGAGTAAYSIDPEIGIAIDVTGTGDTPASLKMSMELGKGPCVKVRDPGMLSDMRVVEWMASTAEKAKIPYQREVLLVGSTDAKAIQVTRAGVMSGALSIPCRYIHSASEMVDFEDLKNSVKLLTAMLSKPISF